MNMFSLTLLTSGAVHLWRLTSLLLIFVCILIAAGDGTTSSRCCWQDHFRTRLGRFAGMPVGGSPGINEEEVNFEFDYSKKRWAISIRDYFITNEYTELIYAEDYKQNKYIVATFQGCARIPLTTRKQMTIPCVPEDAEFLERHRIGAGANSLDYDLWSWNESHIMDDDDIIPFHVNGGYRLDSCLPQMEIAWWNANNFNYTTYIGFLDMETDGSIYDEYTSLFYELGSYYNCKDYDDIPDHMEARPKHVAEIEYLSQRISRP